MGSIVGRLVGFVEGLVDGDVLGSTVGRRDGASDGGNVPEGAVEYVGALMEGASVSTEGAWEL